MPGITGFIGQQAKAEGLYTLRNMTALLAHEPFFRTGTYVSDDGLVGVGWAAHAGSFSDCAPIWNEKHDICLIFSGEDFPDIEEVRSLATKGHHFEPSNASYLVHRYEEEGPGFLLNLNGWFSGLLLDIRQKRVLLFNDRFGVNRIYYYETDGCFFFSSEAKSLLSVFPELRRIDAQGLGELLTLTCILQDRSLFKGISTLPPGAAWTFARGQVVEKRTYFDIGRLERLPALTAEDYYSRLKDIWKRVLPRYFGGRESVGLSLTGGVDSRMILAWAPSKTGTLPCYTFGGRYRDCADVTLSRRIAAVCGQPHQTISVNGDFLAAFRELSQKTVYLSDGAMDLSGTIDLYVQRFARQIAPVRLVGVYGGEILRRLVMFKPRLLQSGLFDRELEGECQKSIETYNQELQGHRLSFTAFKQAPWYMTAKFSIERSQLTFRSPYFDNELLELAYQTPPDLISSNDPSLRLIAEGNPALQGIGTDRGLLLRSVPGLTRAVNALHEFTFKAEYAYDYGMPQWLAKLDHTLSPLRLEKLFLGRHKFHHFRVFYRDELSTYVQEVLLDSKTLGRSYLNARDVEKMVNEHIKGTRNHTTEIHRLMAIELVQRQLIENSFKPNLAVSSF